MTGLAYAAVDAVAVLNIATQQAAGMLQQRVALLFAVQRALVQYYSDRSQLV
jgi:hypothetical protein